MALGYATNLRNARLDAITTFAGTGAKIRLYDGTRPATGAAITTQVLLAELTISGALAAAAAAGVLTLNTVTGDTAADNSGTVTWFRMLKSDNTFIMDGDVGVTGSGDELEMNTVTLVAGSPVEITSFTFTAGNA